MSSLLDLITDAARDIHACGIAETLYAEDLAVALRKANMLFSNWNTRKRFARFERMQTFAVTTSATSYSIGKSTNTPTPTFAVTTGNRPVKIDHANWLVGTGTSIQSWELTVITVETYQEAFYPAMPMVWPAALYYQATLPNGTLWLVPYPTAVTCSLQLFWWDQFDQVAVADITTELLMAPGAELAFGLTLAEMLCIPFGKTLTAGLKESASKARADYQSQNVSPPKLDTTGVSAPAGVYNYPGYW